MTVIQSGKYGGTEFWYLDTADERNGTIIETVTTRTAMSVAVTRYSD